MDSARCSSSVLPPKSSSTRTCPGLGSSATSKTRPAVRRMAAHDGDEDHPVRGEVPLMQREGGRCGPGRIDPGRFLLHKTADAVRALPGGELLGETCRRLGTAVGVADQCPERGCVDDVCCRHDSSSRMRVFAFIILILLYFVRMRGGFPRPRMAQITPRPSSTRRCPADQPSGKPGDRRPRARPHPPPALLRSPRRRTCTRSARRRTSGNQPLPLRSRSASVAISPFFR